MKNPRAFVMVVVSVIIGLAAVVLASRWVSRQATMATNKVVVSAADVGLGTPLTPELLKVVDWPKGSMPEGVFHDPKLLESRVVKANILRGEPFVESKLAPEGTRGGLSSLISPGKRAMTVRVNDVIGVAGFALPGSYVDIVVNTEQDVESDESKGSRSSRSISKIVLEHILVLAVAQEVSQDQTKPKVVNAVTLEVSPEEAEVLDLARSVGTLSLVLRNQVDSAPTTTAGATKDFLLDMARRKGVEPTKTEAAAPAPAPVAVSPKPGSSRSVEVIKGTQRSTEEF